MAPFFEMISVQTVMWMFLLNSILDRYQALLFLLYKTNCRIFLDARLICIRLIS